MILSRAGAALKGRLTDSFETRSVLNAAPPARREKTRFIVAVDSRRALARRRETDERPG